MVQKYNSNSPYSKTSQNYTYLDVWTQRAIPPLDTDSAMTIGDKYLKRPDLLAFALYGDTRLWWVFAVRNPNVIKDPINDFLPGKQIFVTEPNALRDLLNG